VKPAPSRSDRNTTVVPKAMPVEPVFGSAPHLQDDSGKLVAWFTEPAGAVVQLMDAAVFTKEMAEWMVGPGFMQLSQRFVRKSELSVLLDLRPMVSREPAAHPVVMSAAMKYLTLFTKVGVIPPAKPPPLYMTTLHGAVALLSAIGPEIRIYETLEGALQAMPLRAAAK
jgi:hypothetical protein